MKLEGKIIETSEKKEFYIVKEIEKNKKIYLYAVDTKTPQNTNFYELVKENMIPITNDDILKELLFEVVRDNRE